MIFCNSRRFIYFAVPKTATHSVRQLLTPCLTDSDWQQQALFGKDESPISALAAIGHGHLSVKQLDQALPDSDWQSYFKFAFVRHPIERFFSLCAFLNRANPDFVGHETQWMKQAMTVERFRQRVLVRPQIEMLSDVSGKCVMDFIGRYETLQADVERVLKRLELPTQILPRKNVTVGERTRGWLDEPLRQTLTDFYRADFEAFGYHTQ